MAGTQREVRVNNPPTDGITAVQFASTSNTLLCSSWDIRVYDVNANVLRGQFTLSSPIFDVSYLSDDATFVSGSLNGDVSLVSLADGTIQTLGTHSAAVKCVCFDESAGLVASGGWDKSIRVGDPRHGFNCRNEISLPEKVYSMDVSDRRLVVGMSGRIIHVYDMRKLGTPEQKRESSLKFQTRCIRCFPNGEGFALSSVEGRVAMEYFDPRPQVQNARKYAFKCHRMKSDGKETVYPINSMSFHPTYGTFATGGCDGMVNMWDGENRKRLCQFHRYPTSISSMSFNNDGTLLAIASSYTFEEGEKGHPDDEIFVRWMDDTDVKPKPRGRR